MLSKITQSFEAEKCVRKLFADIKLYSDPSSSCREQLRQLIQTIGQSPDKVVEGIFRSREVTFFIQGEDVVVTTRLNEFITLLKGGISNPSVIKALGK